MNNFFKFLENHFFENNLFDDFNEVNLNYNFDFKKYSIKNFNFENKNNLKKQEDFDFLKKEKFENFKKYKKEKRIFETEYLLDISNLKNHPENLKSLKKQKKKIISLINSENQKILDENFENLSNNLFEINLLLKNIKNRIDIKNMWFVSKFVKYLE